MKDRNLLNFWTDMCMLLIGETICQSSNGILGISVSPKKTNGTIRIWLSDTNTDITRFDHLKKIGIDFSKSLIKLNMDS